MPKLDEEIRDSTNESIHEDIAVEKLRKEPYTLPPGYHWDTLNLDDPLVVSGVSRMSICHVTSLL